MILPSPLRHRFDVGLRDLLRAGADVNFTEPFGEPALTEPDSVSWRVFKNPISLAIGGVAAVILELAEPRVRAGVWDHTNFRTAPLRRMRRTGLAAMVTVYGARSTAEAMISRVRRMHDRIEGVTPLGIPYRASDPELLNWVQATAAFGFVEAFSTYVQPVSPEDRDRFYAEGALAAQLYGAQGAPTSTAELEYFFQRMRGTLERSPVVFEFLGIICNMALLPAPLRALQGILVKAAVEVTPAWAREILDLDGRWRLGRAEAALVRLAAAAAERVIIETSPPVQACRRLGLSADFLY